MRKEIERQAELEKMSASLKKKCVDILDNHGELVKKRGLAVVSGTVHNFLHLGFSPTTLKEDLVRRKFSKEIVVRDGKSPVNVTIMSLGDTSPRDANYLLIHIPRINNKSLDIAEGKSVLRLVDSSLGTVGNPHEVGMRMIAGYSKMIDILMDKLSAKPRS